MPGQRDELLRNRDFVKLWAGQTISIFGSLVTRTALPFAAILALDAGPGQIALLEAAGLVPGFLLAMVAGVWVDRLRRRPLLIGADLGRAALLASVPAAAALGALRIELLYAVALLVGILTALFDVAYLSYLPSLVARSQLQAADGRLAASASVAEVAFGLAGWLVQIFTAPLALLLDAVWRVEALPAAPPEGARSAPGRAGVSPASTPPACDHARDGAYGGSPPRPGRY